MKPENEQRIFGYIDPEPPKPGALIEWMERAE